jgi:hypothetical protein
MSEHYTLNTVEVSTWCKVCGKATMHHVNGRRVAGCITCIERLTTELETRISERHDRQPVNGNLFDQA